MKHLIRKILLTTAVSVGLIAGPVQASVVVAGTRVIFPGQDREVTVRLTNNGDTPALVQAWLDDGNADTPPDQMDVPFTVTPAMFRLDSSKGQALRLIYTQEPLAQDKETMYWLNVLEVPPKAQGENDDVNKLQLAFRTRIKVLFRPKGLAGKASESAALVRWDVVRAEGNGYALKATNPTPYFVNLSQVKLNQAGKAYDAGVGFVPPNDSQLFPIIGLTAPPGAGAEVDYISISDFGGGENGKQLLKGPSQ